MKTGRPTQIALSTKTLLFAGDLPRHGKLLPSNSQLESCLYFPCLQGYLKASCGLKLKSEQTNATIPTYSTTKMHQVSNSDPPYPPGIKGRHPEYTWSFSPFPVVSIQTSLDGNPPGNKSGSHGRTTACGCGSAWVSGLDLCTRFQNSRHIFQENPTFVHFKVDSFST